MVKKNKTYGFATRAIHSGAAPEPITGARNIPIYQTTSYVFKNTEHAERLFKLEDFGFIYSRLTNPTVSVLEERLANLENSRAAVACSSGHASQQLVFASLLNNNDHFIASNKLYGGSINQFNKTFRKFGWDCSFVDPDNILNFENAIKNNTKLIFIETLSNPDGSIVDIEAVAKVAIKYHIPLVVDNTLATPFLHNPSDWGANIITHSLTKFICGNGTSMGGIVVDCGNFNYLKDEKFPSLSDPDPSYNNIIFSETFGDFGFAMKVKADTLRDLGCTLSPQNAFYILNGIETLNLRMRKHTDNALKVAIYLQQHPKVSYVSYAGLKNNNYYDLGKKYFPNGPGSIFTIRLKSGYKACVSMVENVKLFSHVANVGDTRSLIIHPASTTHSQLSDKEKVKAGAGPDVIRLSIGLEDIEDIIMDLENSIK
ncbi:MAG: O-acetylhomoserine aminocarboxypropyltransferase [Pelagibacterales bacterium]|nr:O-acetylhomoserine aminocarboxypropyltransferase [Pelagibacterales bacterium]OUU63482.1 MAG: O-acetylhomoserine aminocarboxypropyltransferase [Alphaproteobacteria bacterium TMED62]|tara:strand:- start:3813 stop:5096 length:1284 start_codon:yes stop_codon:yes gene_type:complete